MTRAPRKPGDTHFDPERSSHPGRDRVRMRAEGCEADPPTTKLTDVGARPGTRVPAPRPSRAAVAIDHGLVTMQRTPTTTPSGTSAGEALAPLVQEALASHGVHHPFLRRLASGDLPDPGAALRAYAWEYSGYSAWFPRYLKAVIGRLSSAAHKERLSHNLREEKGLLDGDDCAELRRRGIDPSTVRGVPHPQLFARFCRAVGIPNLTSSACDLSERSSLWRSYLASCRHTLLTQACSQTYPPDSFRRGRISG